MKWNTWTNDPSTWGQHGTLKPTEDFVQKDIPVAQRSKAMSAGGFLDSFDTFATDGLMLS